jgi:hypothetical protein
VFCLPVPDELRSRTHFSRSPTHVTNRGHPLDRAPPSSETTDELREEEDRRTQFSGYFSSVFHRCSCIASCWDRIGTEVVASRSRDGIPLSSVVPRTRLSGPACTICLSLSQCPIVRAIITTRTKRRGKPDGSYPVL